MNFSKVLNFGKVMEGKLIEKQLLKIIKKYILLINYDLK